MRRLVWASLGAAGGILAYRKVQELALAAKEKGMLVTISETTSSLKELAQGASDQIAKIKEHSPNSTTITGSAAAAVVEQQQRK